MILEMSVEKYILIVKKVTIAMTDIESVKRLVSWISKNERIQLQDDVLLE